MAKADLSADRLRDILNYDQDTGIFSWRIDRHCVQRGARAGYSAHHGYWMVKVDQKPYLAHRLAWLHVHGRWPSEVIDHINGDTSDNRIANLREVTQRVNQQNRRIAQSNNRTGFLGVSIKKNRASTSFAAHIVINGKRTYVGVAQSAEAAHQLYLDAKRRLHEGNTL